MGQGSLKYLPFSFYKIYRLQTDCGFLEVVDVQFVKKRAGLGHGPL
jgi:hypothetical protein